MRMDSAGEGEQIPVIVVFEKRPAEEFDLQSLSDATAKQKLQGLAERQQQRAKSYIQQQRERNRAGQARTLWSTNSMAVRATPGTIEELAGLPNVERIVYDQEVQKASDGSHLFSNILSAYGNTTAAPEGFEESTSGDRAWSIEYIGADAVQERGVKGQGVNVSVVDTGIDGDHPALEGAVTEWKDFTPDNYTTPTDPHGHGTHVAGTVAARPVGEHAVGVAPKANLFGAKVFSENPEEHPTRVSDIVQAFEWSADNGADVVSASLGIAPLVDSQGGNTTMGSDGTAQNDVRVYANATGAYSTNFSTDAYKPSYVFVIVEPIAVNGTDIQYNDSRQAAVMNNVSVALADPSGNESLKGVNASWAFLQGEVPEQIVVRKYKPTESRPLTQDGNWTLTVTSETGQNVTYRYTAAPVYPTNGSDELAESVNTVATSHDVMPVISAGNAGFVLGNRSVGSPGAASEAITVGATGYRTNDIALYSSRGPVGYGADERPGVDLIAPGTNVLSTIPDEMYPDSDYAYYSGTSMAAPHVSGTLALMRSAEPTATRSELETTLESTAQDVPGGQNAVGAGVVDAYRAVNQTNASALGPETTESGRHTLYAGLGNTEDSRVYVDVDPHEDPSGDAGNAPDIWVTRKLVVDNFELATYDSTSPNATFRLYIDADRDNTTGDAGQNGADYMIVMNRTYDGSSYYLTEEGYEYDATNGVYVQSSNITAYTGSVSGRFIELFDISIANRDMSVPFDWHVTSAERGSSPGDRFPNTGQATTGISQEINGTAVAWNASAGEPESNANITFELYNRSGYLVSNETVQTNADGRASSNQQVTLMGESYDEYALEISDTHGNNIVQTVDVSGACIEGCLLDGEQTGISYTVRDRDYEIPSNETLQLNIPVYDASGGNLTTYTGEASLRLYNYGNDEQLVIDNVTVTDGVIRTEIDFGQLAIDDSGYYIDIDVALEGDYQNASAYADGGDIRITGGDTYTQLAPSGTKVKPGQSANLSFQTYEYPGSKPNNVSVEYETLWVTDRYVAALYDDLPQDVAQSLEERRHTLGTEKMEQLTLEERHEVREAVENLTTQGIHVKITNGTAAPTRRGVGTFNVTPPEDTRYGIVLAKPNTSGTDYYTGTSIVFVEDRVNSYGDKQTEPRETDDYDLDVYSDWDSSDRGDGLYVPDENFTVSVELRDDRTGEALANRTVKLYTTLGHTVTVTTDQYGSAQVTLSAPDRDWQNVSYDFRQHEVLGVAEGLNTQDGEPVSDTGYFDADVYDVSSSSDDGVRALPELRYKGNGTLQATIYYENQSTYEPTAGKKTLVVLTDGSEWSARGDLRVDFIDPGSQTNVTFNVTDPTPPATDESAEYELGAQTADMSYDWEDWEYVSGFSVSVQAPYEVIDGETATLTFNVTDRNGDPVENAAVRFDYLYADIDAGDRSGNSLVPYPVDGGTAIATTDSNGVATVEVRADIAESLTSNYLYYTVGVATENTSNTYASSGSILVDQESFNVTGRMVYPNNSTVANDTVFARGPGTSDRTAASGEFRLTIGENPADLVFYQTHENGTPGALDNTPDVYTVGEVSGETSLGNVSLPNAHRLNVTVVDEDGNPVENASVVIKHSQNGAVGGDGALTNEHGMFEIANRTGVEVVGNVTVEVSPPSGAERYVEQTKTKTLTVTQDGNVTVTLDEKELVEGRIVYPDNSTVADDAVIGWGWGQFTRTDSDGQFLVPVGSGTGEVVFYQFRADDTPGPIDGVPDAYALGAFNNSTDLGNVTLPDAHRVNVTVVDEDGNPVQNAGITVSHDRNGADGGWTASANEQGMFEISNRTGAEMAGNVSIEVLPPEGSDRFVERQVTKNITVTSDRDVVVTLDEKPQVEGRIVYPDNSTAADDLVIGWGWNQYVRTESDGRFNMVMGNGSGEVVFVQAHENFTGSENGYPGALDGAPDFYAIGTFNNSTDLGNVTLPDAHRLNVTVVTQNGEPVNDARVGVGHTQDGATVGWGSLTNADGKYVIGDRVGAEVVGNITVEVREPPNATGYEDETKTRNLTVTSDEEVTVTLNTTQNMTTGVEVTPTEANTTVSGTTTYDIVVTSANGGVGAYEGNFTVANASVGEIVNVELQGNPGVSTVNISADNSSVYFDGAIADTNDSGRVVIATVTVAGNNSGQTSVNADIAALGNEDGVSYTVSSITGATLNVEDIGKLKDAYDGPPQDVDGDGVYEDINGDGQFDIVDVQALYTVREFSTVQDNVDRFDVNGDGTVDIVDVQALYVEQGGS